ncbi:MAG: ATP-binding protein [Gammaproteobacteria bacterium]
MQKDIQQLAESISATLKLMRNVDAGTINRDDFNIYEIEPCIWNVLNYYPFAAGEKELVHFDSSQNFSFLGHHVLFYRILFNLMNNALQQITKNKRGEIFISTEEDEQYNILRFRDTAGGAAPEIVKHLFEGFKTTKKDGNGVGLAFCKITMHSFKGDITCHSVEGDYIEFVLSFPKIANETQQLI